MRSFGDIDVVVFLGEILKTLEFKTVGIVPAAKADVAANFLKKSRRE